MRRNVLFMDIESHNAGRQYGMEPHEFFRLGQYAWGRTGDVQLTSNYNEFMDVLESADLIVGHNIVQFDLPVLYGQDSMRPLELALEHKVWDTFVAYPLRFRVPYYYNKRDGKKGSTLGPDGKQKPGQVASYLSLENLTFQHDLPGKLGNLQELAKKYNPPKTLVADLDYSLIPLDDPDFLAYAEQDVIADRGLACYMMDRQGISAYEWREMLVMSINAQMTRNGFTVDTAVAQAKIDELAEKKERIMAQLVEEYDFPTAGKSPWASAKGKEVIMQVLADHGITPETRTDWEQTKTGYSLGGQELIRITEGTAAEDFAVALAALKGQRTLPQLAIDSTKEDGKAHPRMTSLQRSGRFSMTDPSLPIWGSRTKELARDKEYFIASPGCKLVEMDYSNADQRIVAALSGDKNYLKRFEPGADGHEISGRLMFGDEAYEAAMLPGWETDDKIRKENPLRHKSKALSHAFAYNAGPKTLARTSGIPEEEDPLGLAYKFIDAMNTAYPDNKRWRERAYEEGLTGWVTNDWGRRMPVDKDRSYTQSPGLYGQSGTREIMCDGLIAIAQDKIEVLRWIVATVHDAIIWDIPETELEWAVPYIVQTMELTFKPKVGGQAVHFPLSAGKPADNWMQAGH